MNTKVNYKSKKLWAGIACALFLYFVVFDDPAIRRSFNKAFSYRATGDCQAFIGYVVTNMGEWRSRCENEKNAVDAIQSFKILRVTHRGLSNRAFLQVQLDRGDKPYAANYQMKRVGILWKIDQQLQ